MNILSKISLLSFFAICLLSCRKDRPDGSNDTYFSLTQMLSFLPTEYTTGRKAVYINEQGTRRTFAIYRDSVRALPITTTTKKEFTIEQLSIVLRDIDKPRFNILVGLSTEYSESFKKPFWTYSCIIPPQPKFGIMINATFDKDLKPVPEVSFGNFTPSITLAERTFKDCYWLKVSGQTSFSEIYLNSSQGLPAFRAENDELWVFDRFE
jgi:hypothetical protein